MMLARTAVIIPARNEEASLDLVLSDLPAVAGIIVVDNGSTDDTAAVAKSAGCFVVEEPIPGYGRACQTGMRHLETLAASVDVPIEYVAFLDADYSDHPQELGMMLDCIKREQADFVLGSRMHAGRDRGAMPPQAVWGNWLACTLMRWIWKTSYSDLGPFRVIQRDKLFQLGMQDLNFGWTIEMQIKAHLAGLRIREIPVSYRRRIGVSKISGTLSGTIRAGYKILSTIARYAIASRRMREQLCQAPQSQAIKSRIGL